MRGRGRDDYPPPHPYYRSPDPPREPYRDPYYDYYRRSYPPPPDRYRPYDPYERRRPPPPSDPYYDRDPYARPPPDYYRRSPPPRYVMHDDTQPKMFGECYGRSTRHLSFRGDSRYLSQLLYWWSIGCVSCLITLSGNLLDRNFTFPISHLRQIWQSGQVEYLQQSSVLRLMTVDWQQCSSHIHRSCNDLYIIFYTTEW